MQTLLLACQYRCRRVLQKTADSHLHVQAEERVVSQEAIAAGRSHQVACEGHVAVWVPGLEQRGWPMHHLIHVAAHTVQRQIVCHLHMVITQSKIRYSIPQSPSVMSGTACGGTRCVRVHWKSSQAT